MRAWVFQDHRQQKRLGVKAPWSAGWVDPAGKRRSKRIGSKSLAEKFARKIEGQLAAGIYESEARVNWAEFKAEYESMTMAAMEPGTRESAQQALDHFERLIKPVKMRSITSKTLADYVAIRRLEPRCRPRKSKAQTSTIGSTKDCSRVSPATVNKELRTMRAVLRKAVRWSYLSKMPDIDFLKEPGKLVVYVTPEHFTSIYKACETARWPAELPYAAGDWWRGLLISAYMTGWRIGSLLALRREHVDLEVGTAVSLAKHNKGKRDQKIPLHPIVIEHLRKLVSFSPVIFPWDRSRRSLYEEYHSIQTAAEVRLTGRKPLYGFHDLRRAFATMNADRLTPDALQALMQHKAYQTTQRYINMSRQLDPAVASLFVPKVTTA